jgi:hypothetical protein
MGDLYSGMAVPESIRKYLWALMAILFDKRPYRHDSGMSVTPPTTPQQAIKAGRQ